VVCVLYVVVMWTGPDFTRGRMLIGLVMIAGALALWQLEVRKTRSACPRGAADRKMIARKAHRE